MLGCEAVNAGENGREIPRREEELARFEGLLAAEKPDLLLVMLGTNDLLQGRSAAAAAQRLEAFLAGIALERKRIILIAPPPMRQGAWITDPSLLSESEALGAACRETAGRLGVRFVDTGGWDIEMTYDGVHCSEQGHRVFARRLFRTLRGRSDRAMNKE